MVCKIIEIHKRNTQKIQKTTFQSVFQKKKKNATLIS